MAHGSGMAVCNETQLSCSSVSALSNVARNVTRQIKQPSIKREAVRLIKGLSGATLEEIEAGAKGWLKNCRACVNSATKRKLPRV
ncbi:uncharacterized protein ISCGN_013283 [Ixodes scapularis]